jgi:hypothetical protein
LSGAPPARGAARRRPIARSLAAAVLFASAAAPAAAQQDRPPEAPTRDVALTYRVFGGAVPAGRAELRMAWLAAEGLVRTELPGGMWTVADAKNPARGFMVMEQMRMVMPMPAGAEAPRGAAAPGDAAAAATRYARAGTAAYAGQSCTVWCYENANQRDGEVCVTADGVTLRAASTRKGETAGMEATQVEYGPQDPSRFRRPNGYQVLGPPAAAPDAGAPKQ